MTNGPALGDGEKRISLMTPNGAQMAWSMFRDAVAMLDLFDWAEVRERMNFAHSAGHIIDPTGYRALINDSNAADNLKFAQAVETFLGACKNVAEEARARKATADERAKVMRDAFG